jgi:uncharacterized protein (TIGR02466 family)
MDIFNFSEHIGIFSVDHQVIDETIPLLYDLREHQPNTDYRSNINGWQKNDLHLLSEFDSLKQILVHQFDVYISHIYQLYFESENEIEPEWAISVDNLFCNINPKGAYHVLHSHSGSNYSGVLYLQSSPESSGSILLECPFVSPWMGNIAGNTMDRYKTVDPVKGLGLIFPAYLLHHVGPNMSDNDRISISWNMTCHFNPQVSSMIRNLEES